MYFFAIFSLSYVQNFALLRFRVQISVSLWIKQHIIEIQGPWPSQSKCTSRSRKKNSSEAGHSYLLEIRGFFADVKSFDNQHAQAEKNLVFFQPMAARPWVYCWKIRWGCLELDFLQVTSPHCWSKARATSAQSGWKNNLSYKEPFIDNFN